MKLVESDTGWRLLDLNADACRGETLRRDREYCFSGTLCTLYEGYELTAEGMVTG